MSPAPRLGDAPAPAGRVAPARPLPAGTRLRDYELQAVVSESDVAVVYAAWDRSLQRKVAVKEYLPSALATRDDEAAAVAVAPGRSADAFRAGLKSFVDEARLLARFDHPSLLKVYRFWEDNGTAYRAMPFHDGPTLAAALGGLGRVPGEAELRAWLKPILDAVTVLHGGRTWHRHVGPEGILLTPVGPVLLGLGAAARALAAARGEPAAALLPGYAAPEQYGVDADARSGPWTDLYGLAAVVYGAIAGAPPDAADDRLTGDALQPLSQVAAGLYDAGFLAAIDAAMALDPMARPQDHAGFRRLMGDIEAAPPVSLAPPRDLMQEPFLGGIDADREVTVPDRPLLVPATPPPPVSAPATEARRFSPATMPARLATAVAADERAPAPVRARRASSPASADGEAGKAGEGRVGRAGKRALYGVVAATCACIGIAALALQFYLRPAARGPAATSASTPSAASAAAVAPMTPASPTSRPAATSTPTSTPTPAVAPTTAAPSAPPTDAERQVRCIDILQKASLEPISAADTEFFKKECK